MCNGRRSRKQDEESHKLKNIFMYACDEYAEREVWEI